MGQTRRASNTQKMIMLSLHEGWRLRCVEVYGWCLFQPGRERPFAQVKRRTVNEMSRAGWLTSDQTIRGLGFRPGKDLTTLGDAFAKRLAVTNWAEEYRWDPLDQTGRSTASDPGESRAAA